jgi:hypothetical protein
MTRSKSCERRGKEKVEKNWRNNNRNWQRSDIKSVRNNDKYYGSPRMRAINKWGCP